MYAALNGVSNYLKSVSLAYIQDESDQTRMFAAPRVAKLTQNGIRDPKTMLRRADYASSSTSSGGGAKRDRRAPRLANKTSETSGSGRLSSPFLLVHRDQQHAATTAANAAIARHLRTRNA